MSGDVGQPGSTGETSSCLGFINGNYKIYLFFFFFTLIKRHFVVLWLTLVKTWLAVMPRPTPWKVIGALFPDRLHKVSWGGGVRTTEPGRGPPSSADVRLPLER